MTASTITSETTTAAAEDPAGEQPAESPEAAINRQRRQALKLRTIIGGRYSGPSDTAEMEHRATILARGRVAVPEAVRGNSSTTRHATGMCVAYTCARRCRSSSSMAGGSASRLNCTTAAGT